MKLSVILEDDENMMVPLAWLSREQRKALLQKGYEVIPISGYHETEGYRACKIIGKYTDDIWWIRMYSIPIWGDWKLTAKYAASAELINSTTGQQMFDHMDDDEKIQALKHHWFDNLIDYIIKYFREHPDLLKRAKRSLNDDSVEDVVRDFKDLF